MVVRTDDPYVHHEMTYLQMGDGPYFALYRPYHLASIEAPLTVYEMALDHRASLISELLDRRGRCRDQAPAEGRRAHRRHRRHAWSAA